MQRVWLCLQTQHDWRLVVLAVLVSLLTCLATFSMFQRTKVSSGHPRVIWLCITGLITGCGIWSTHFIAMLAYMPDVPFRFDQRLTFLSLLIALLMVTAGFAAALLNRTIVAVALGGFLIGAGIAGMHYLGLASIEAPVIITMDLDLVVWSIVLGMAFAGGAILVARRRETFARMVTSTLLLCAAILSHHFVSMGGLLVAPSVSTLSLHLAEQQVAAAIAAAVLIAVAACLIGTIIDRRVAQSAHQRNAQFSATLNNMSQGLYMFGPDRRLQLWNQRFADIYRIPPAWLKRGMSMDEMQDAFVAAGALANNFREYAEQVRAAFTAGHPAACTIELKDGRIIQANFNLMPDGGWVATHEDITERVATRERMEYLTKHDAMTSLPNRVQFDETLKKIHQRCAETGQTLAVLDIDLDHLKAVNDDCGQAAGDAAIVEIARRFSAVCDEDSLFRLGGDEFAVINQGPQPLTAERLSKALQDALTEPMQLGALTVRLSCTIGISVFPQDGEDREALVSNAGTALKRAKETERGTVSFFQKEMDRDSRAKREMQKELAEAIERGQLQLHYQPQAETGSRNADQKIVGFEALLRWSHPQFGEVSPAVFIPLAEEMGLIPAIDGWVLNEACREAASWDRPLGIAVNLSPETFRRVDVTHLIHTVLVNTGLRPSRLEIEITEGVLIGDFNAACAALRRIKALGVQVALDDFGTGYSSLSYLQAFPFDRIKIDQTFVANLPARPQSVAIVKSVIGLGRSLGLPVLAEGVETQEQLAFLRAKRCDQVQGFLIGRPRPISDYAHLCMDETEDDDVPEAIAV